jgi:hypothetical protein
MRRFKRVLRWLMLWPVLLPLRLRRRGRAGRICASVWVGFWVLVISLTILNSPPDRPSKAIAPAAGHPVLVTTN